MPTPTESTDTLVDGTVQLHLPRQVENARLIDLKKMRTFIGDGRITPAVNRLDTFVGRVEDEMAEGKIAEDDGNKLPAIAQDLIAALRSNSDPHRF